MRNKKLLLDKIREKKCKIAVIGLGYVGLPLAILFAKNGYRVNGYTKTQKKIEDIKSSNTELSSLNPDIKRLQNSKKFTAKLISDESLGDNDVFIICLPTPITKDNKPEISALKQVSKYLSKISLENRLIVNESTVAPFTTEQLFGKYNDNYFLTCSPERVDPGNDTKTIGQITKLIGGIDADSLEVGLYLYKKILKDKILPVNNMYVAEMSKMLENTYRAVNIALINEFALLSDALDINLLEVIQAAKSKWSFQAHYPGIGVGGHCIPVDPYYVLDIAEKKGLRLNVIKSSLKRNSDMPLYVAQKVKGEYKKGMKVIIYGISYKKNVPDLRESPVIELCKILKKLKIDFGVYDPLLTKEAIESLGLKFTELRSADMLIIGSDHDQLSSDYKKIVTKETIVVDGKNFFKGLVGGKLIGIGHSF